MCLHQWKILQKPAMMCEFCFRVNIQFNASSPRGTQQFSSKPQGLKNHSEEEADTVHLYSQCKHLHLHTCMYAHATPHEGPPPTLLIHHPSYRENPILSITCFSRWNLAYTGVEGKKICFLFSPLQTKILVFFTEQSLLWCVYICVCTSWPGVPRFYQSHGCVTPFPSQAEREGTPDSSSPESTPDPRVHCGGPSASPQRHRLFPGSNKIPPFMILSGVFTPILPKPIEERANSAATDLKQIEFPRVQIKNVPQLCFKKKVGCGAGAEQGR